MYQYSEALEAHEKYLTQGSGISDFLQLRNAGFVIVAASVAAANPIEYRLGLFASMTRSLKVNGIKLRPPKKKLMGNVWLEGV